ncbi:MAG TPA: FN3 associated domain-containing protein [Puia sp.]|nr:FN3 associated domain-containing protein [Puia sp.]
MRIPAKPAPIPILIALNAMLLFLVLLDNHLVIPRWLQVAGRLHPLILHFPIVLVVAYAIYLWFGPAVLADELLLATSFTAVITALAGVFLSRQGSYEGSAIQWHKWLGTVTSVILLALCLIKPGLYPRLPQKKWLAILPLATVIIAGHYGGDLSHGAGYVLAPLKSATVAPSLEEARVYDDLVFPIIDVRCLQCHNAGTSKGGLNMEDPREFAKGGRDGKPWDTTAEGLGLLLARIRLPAEDRKHMPPADKTQLTDLEQHILYAWIKDGAPFDKKVIDLEPTDTLRFYATRQFKAGGNDKFDFSAADEKKIAALNTNYRAITPLATGSPALAVDFYGAAFFQSKQLQELSPVKDQIVSLNLDKMPVVDDDLPYVAAFRNLRTLNLDFTRITGAGLVALTRLPHLESLSLSGTAVKAADLDRLATMSSLRKLYVWKTGVAPTALDGLRQRRKDLDLYAGFYGDTVRIRISPPRLETEARIIRDTGVSIRLRHFVPGTTIRYTLDGSDPDSGGKVYTGPFVLRDRSQFRAKAYKPGWLSSDPTNADFYTQKYPPDSIRLLLPVDSNYLKIRPVVLINADKGGFDYGSGKWLGFHKNGLSALLYYRKPVTITDVTFSSLVDIAAYIFPPASLEVWGGPDERHLKKLGSLTPAQPTATTPPYLTAYRVNFPPQKIRCLKVEAGQVPHLPDWHPGKGQPGWVFFDELLMN